MTDNLEGTLREVRSLKASAQSARDDGDWADAVDDLNMAVTLVRKVRESGLARGSEARLDAELADAYGQIGGVERRWGLASIGLDRRHHLQLSTDAYDNGFVLEQHLEAREAATYNRINRLVGRVLLDPGVLEGVSKDSVDVPLELSVAEEILEAYIEASRQRDPWAYCDMGTIKVLRGEDWLPVVRALERLRPPHFVYESWLSTLAPLSEVASAIRPALPELIELVERAARYTR
jgi:hypothetical protein